MATRLRHASGRRPIIATGRHDHEVDPEDDHDISQHKRGDRRRSIGTCLRISAVVVLIELLLYGVAFVDHRGSNNRGLSQQKMASQKNHDDNSGDAIIRRPASPPNKKRQAACQRMKSVDDIRTCYPDTVRSLGRDNCDGIESWEDVQRCLVGRFIHDASNSTITQINIVGERNSGTKFVTNELQKCFPRTDNFRVRRGFLREKHWFQPVNREPEDYSTQLIVVVIREPFEWMASMLQSPYHSPEHVAGYDEKGNVIPLPWRDFVSRPLITTRASRDRGILLDPVLSRNNTICRHGFTPKQIIPCQSDPTEFTPKWKIPKEKYRGFHPIYEQRQTDGTPFDHFLQLRSDKIVNWVLQLPMLLNIGGMVVVRYEDLLALGTEFLVQQIADILADSDNGNGNKQAMCKTAPPQPERIGRRKVPQDFRKWIDENIDVATERLVGYRTNAKIAGILS